jgi:hypothetical protein
LTLKKCGEKKIKLKENLSWRRITEIIAIIKLGILLGRRGFSPKCFSLRPHTEFTCTRLKVAPYKLNNRGRGYAMAGLYEI